MAAQSQSTVRQDAGKHRPVWCHASKRSQSGIALLVIVFLFLGIGTTVFLKAWNNARERQERELRTEQALRLAKEALIAFAATHGTLPGRLPCPEDTGLIGTPNEGNEQGSCSNTSSVAGRLPWHQLGLEKLTDVYGEQLWYIRSPGFQRKPINSDTLGQLQLDGTANAAAALIVAPGPPLPGQNRTVPTGLNPPDIKQYLDLGNSTGPAYQSMGPVDSFNDRVLAITREELFRAVEQRVAKETRIALNAYYAVNGYYPNPARFADTTCLGNNSNSSGCLNDASTCSSTVCRGRIPANISLPAAPWGASDLLRGPTGGASDWFQSNGWRELIYYALAPACAEGTSWCSGTAFLKVRNTPGAPIVNIPVIAIGSGPALVAIGQARASPTDKTLDSNYLEDINLTPSTNMFTGSPTAAGTPFNDWPVWLP